MTELSVALVATALVGALAGAACYAVLVAGWQARRIGRLLDQLTDFAGGAHRLDTSTVRDRRLRASLDSLAGRLSDTWTLATTDLLTNVMNRQALLTRLADELERAGRYRRDLSIVLIDLDNFKRLNDGYGHAAGDKVLHEVAATLRSTVRAVDLVGRYGGEEFMIILPETDVDAAAALAEKLRRVVESRGAVLPEGHVIELTISAGVAGGNGDLRLDALIRDADAALYSAKALGRNQVYVFRELAEGGLIRRAPVEPAARELAVEVGRAAMAAAREALADVLGAQQGWAGRPSMMIAETATSVGRALGLPEGEIERIRTASLLHDLGKLAIPDEILSKPGELVEPEWRVVAEHPRVGQIVLEQAGALRDAAMIVLHHHEWYDGRGYPYGLAAHEIPVGARIVAIADAYEAMVAGRPYRPAISHQAALTELRRHAGVQFDPELVDVFTSLFADGVPWQPERAGHAHPHPHLESLPGIPDEVAAEALPKGRPVAEIHDGLHARRRRAVLARRAPTAVELADAGRDRFGTHG